MQSWEMVAKKCTAQHPIFGTIMVSPYGRILLVQGRSTQKWSLPKGKINPNESFLECAIRETYEETGILLPNTIVPRFTLTAGRYFLYYVDQEFSPKPLDTNEIMDARWFSEDDLKNLPSINVDVSTFLRKYTRLLFKKQECSLCTNYVLPQDSCMGKSQVY